MALGDRGAVRIDQTGMLVNAEDGEFEFQSGNLQFRQAGRFVNEGLVAGH